MSKNSPGQFIVFFTLVLGAAALSPQNAWGKACGTATSCTEAKSGSEIGWTFTTSMTATNCGDKNWRYGALGFKPTIDHTVTANATTITKGSSVTFTYAPPKPYGTSGSWSNLPSIYYHNPSIMGGDRVWRTTPVGDWRSNLNYFECDNSSCAVNTYSCSYSDCTASNCTSSCNYSGKGYSNDSVSGDRQFIRENGATTYNSELGCSDSYFVYYSAFLTFLKPQPTLSGSAGSGCSGMTCTPTAVGTYTITMTIPSASYQIYSMKDIQDWSNTHGTNGTTQCRSSCDQEYFWSNGGTGTVPGTTHTWTITVNPKCGDGVCDGGESCSSCAGDCGACTYCGDGIKNGTEACDLGDATHGNGNGACPKLCSATCTAQTCCTPLTFQGSSVTPTSLSPGQAYTIRCNYGSSSINSVYVTPGSGTCNFDRYDANDAVFGCTAGSSVGTFSNSCYIKAGTTSNNCARTDAIGQLRVFPPTSLGFTFDDGSASKTITAGQSATLKWSPGNMSWCWATSDHLNSDGSWTGTADGDPGGDWKASSGLPTQSVSPAVGTYTYTLKCGNGINANADIEKTVTLTVEPPPTSLGFTFDDGSASKTITAGQSATLKWSPGNMSWCWATSDHLNSDGSWTGTADGDPGGDWKASSGLPTQSVSPAVGTYTYTLKCGNGINAFQDLSKTVMLTVNPPATTLDFTFDDGSTSKTILTGEGATLNWSPGNMSWCWGESDQLNADGGWTTPTDGDLNGDWKASADVALPYSQVISSIGVGTYSYSLDCGNGIISFMDQHRSVTLIVNPAACSLDYEWITQNPSCSGKCGQTLPKIHLCRNKCTGDIETDTGKCTDAGHSEPAAENYTCSACQVERGYREVQP